MIQGHYGALVVSYGAGLLGWLALSRLRWSPWPAGEEVRMDRPWRSLGVAFLAVVVVLLVGQAYIRGYLFPERGALSPMWGAVDQLLIFSPVLLLLVFRGDGLESAWLAPGRIPARLGGGVLVAFVALLTYTLVRSGSGPVWVVAGRILRFQHLDEAVQVLLEDITIAMLFVRLASGVGKWWAVALVAILFAAAHVPALIAGGRPFHEILLLARDAALGAGIIAVLQRSRDVLWFWCLHFVMDMTQFAPVVFGR